MQNDAPDRIWAVPVVGAWDGAVCSNAPIKDGTEYLRRDLCASGQQVRALEWLDAGHGIQSAGTPFGTTSIEPTGYYGGAGQIGGKAPNMDTAKAAAQADYESRILSALTPLASAPGLAEAATELLHVYEQGGAYSDQYSRKVRAALTPAPQPEGQVRALMDAADRDADRCAERIAELERLLEKARAEAKRMDLARDQFLGERNMLAEALRSIASGDMTGMMELTEAEAAKARATWAIKRIGTPVAALTPAPDAAQTGAVPVAWRFKHIHLPDKWKYSENPHRGLPWTGFEPLYTHPAAPAPGIAEAITAAQVDAAAIALSKRIYTQTEGEWQPNIRQADELARAALKAALANGESHD